MNLNEPERLARFRLFRSQSVGPITFYKLLSRFGNAQKALDALPSLSYRRKSPVPMSVTEAEAELNALENYGGRLIVYGDDEYPIWLSTVEDSPPILSVIGDASLLSKSCLAIVGARNASANAKRYTESIARELGQKGQIIVSGLARGLDTAAHKASLETGTIAVVAGGLDAIYPTENTDLYHAIAKQGCIISEMPFGTKPTAHHFPRRNRIVSALSKGVLVVEASMKSGSLITARMASEQGREVFAVPGFPGDPRAAGPNHLIQNGAKLIQNADDILVELIAMQEKTIQPQNLFDSVNEDGVEFINDNNDETLTDTILDALSYNPIEVDEISRLIKKPIASMQTPLLELELTGEIIRHPGNRISKAA